MCQVPEILIAEVIREVIKPSTQWIDKKVMPNKLRSRPRSSPVQRDERVMVTFVDGLQNINKNTREVNVNRVKQDRAVKES